jgi:hypothetical protein
MTLSILMYGMMACALVALLGALIVEALGSRVNVLPRAHIAERGVRPRHGRVRHDPGCPQRAAGSSPAARAASRSRSRATPGSRRRWAA